MGEVEEFPSLSFQEIMRGVGGDHKHSQGKSV
jgi:hypothetical protein